MRIAEELIHDKKREMVTIPSTSSISDALALMHRENVGCVLVTEDDTIVGIWTERDLARDLAMDGFGIATAPVGDYMTHPLITCEWSDSVYSLVDVILGRRVRHLVVTKDGTHIGLISAGDVMKATLREKDRELAEANAAKSWQYYEEWMHK